MSQTKTTKNALKTAERIAREQLHLETLETRKMDSDVISLRRSGSVMVSGLRVETIGKLHAGRGMRSSAMGYLCRGAWS